MSEVNYSLFESWSAEQAWWWGVFLGDGNSYEGYGNYDINLTGDISTVRRWLGIFSANNAIHLSKKCKKERYSSHVRNKEFFYWFYDRYGIKGPKTFSIKWIEGLPEEFVSDFLRGLWDSDGSIHYSDQKTYDKEFKTKYCSVVRSMVERVRDEVCARVDAPSNKITEEERTDEETGKTYTWYVIRWAGQSAVKVLNYIYGNSPEHLRNEERYDMYQTFIKDDAMRKSRVCPCGKSAARYGLCQKCWHDKKGRKVNIKATCEECNEVKKILGRNLCSACYSRLRRAGKLKKKVKLSHCACGKPSKYRNNTCRTCYGKMRVLERVQEGFEPSYKGEIQNG